MLVPAMSGTEHINYAYYKANGFHDITKLFLEFVAQDTARKRQFDLDETPLQVMVKLRTSPSATVLENIWKLYLNSDTTEADEIVARI